LFNDSLSALVLRKNIDPEQILGKVFRPGALSDTLDFKLAVSPLAWKKAQVSWLADLYEKSTVTAGRETAGEKMFAPTKFVRSLEPYLRSGQLEVILEGEAAQKLKALLPVFQRFGRAETLGGNPSGTAGGLLGYGQISTLIGSGVAAVSGQPGLALSGVGAAALPYGLGVATTSKTGIRVLSQGLGLEGTYSEPALRFAMQVLTGEVLE